MAKYNVNGVKVGDRVVIGKGHHGDGVVFTIEKVCNRITHYAAGRTDAGSYVNVPLHWVKSVEPEG